MLITNKMITKTELLWYTASKIHIMAQTIEQTSNLLYSNSSIWLMVEFLQIKLH